VSFSVKITVGIELVSGEGFLSKLINIIIVIPADGSPLGKHVIKLAELDRRKLEGIVLKHQRLTVSRAKGIFVNTGNVFGRVCTRKRNPGAKIEVCNLLCNHVVVVIVAGVKGNGQSHGFDVKSVSARSTGVNKFNLIQLYKIFPVVIMSLNALVFGHTGAVGVRSVVKIIVYFRTAEVHILSVYGNSTLGKHLGNLCLKPCPALIVSDVKLTVMGNIGILIFRLVRLAVTDQPLGFNA
jgi:hypothetical protein